MAFRKQNRWILISFDLNTVLTKQTSEKVACRPSLGCLFGPRNFKKFWNWGRGCSSLPPSPLAAPAPTPQRPNANDNTGSHASYSPDISCEVFFRRISANIIIISSLAITPWGYWAEISFNSSVKIPWSQRLSFILYSEILRRKPLWLFLLSAWSGESAESLWSRPLRISLSCHQLLTVVSDWRIFLIALRVIWLDLSSNCKFDPPLWLVKRKWNLWQLSSAEQAWKWDLLSKKITQTLPLALVRTRKQEIGYSVANPNLEQKMWGAGGGWRVACPVGFSSLCDFLFSGLPKKGGGARPLP